MNYSGKNVSSNKLLLLVTVVNRRKAEFYTDFIQYLGANLQFVSFGEGTADASILSRMGLSDNERAVIFSVIREENQDAILRSIEEKFNAMKNGNGIAYTIPFSSVIGVSVFNFMSDNRTLFK